MISVFLTLCHSCDLEDIEVGQQFYTSLEYQQLSSTSEKNLKIIAYSKQSHSILITDVLYNTLSTILEGLHQLLVNRCIHVQQLIGPYFGDLIKGTGKLFPDILRFIINMVSSIDEHLHELSVPVTNEIQQVKNYKSSLYDSIDVITGRY
uniref:Uncharacterized protein n=1 Tax=Amphimedon queenslandica TaxID=400682 RepID=A0A1X7U5G2_AMPQE